MSDIPTTPPPPTGNNAWSPQYPVSTVSGAFPAAPAPSVLAAASPPFSPSPPPPRQAVRRNIDNLATKHLCAGVYVDESFQRQVLGEIYHRPHRAVAPDAGVDTTAVIGHALHSRRMHLLQAFLLLPGLPVLVILSITVAEVVIVLLLLLWLLAWTRQGWTRSRRLQAMTGLRAGREGSTVLMGLITIFLTLYFLLPLLTDALIYQRLFPRLNPLVIPEVAIFGVARGSGRFEDFTAVLMCLAVILTPPVLIVVSFALHRRRSIGLLGSGLGKHGDPRDRRSLAIRNTLDGDVVNYGGFEPFAVSGRRERTWQFALPLHPLPHGEAPAPGTRWPHFDEVSLGKHIRRELGALAVESDSFSRLPGLTLRDMVFVSGLETVAPTYRAQDLALSGLPSDLDDIAREPTTPVRRYLRCQIASWGGEVVTTVYVHAALQGQTLYMEFSSFLLCPTPGGFHIIEEVNQATGTDSLALMLRSICNVPHEIFRSPLVIARRIKDALAASRNRRDAPDGTIGFVDYGARTSVRLLRSSTVLKNYFQGRDAVKYIKILEARLLDSTVEFLADKVDVSELKTRASTIVNNIQTVYTASVTGTGNVGAMGPGSSARTTLEKL